MCSLGLKDWIVAPATASGHGAVAIVRLDGPGCWQVAAAVWKGRGEGVQPPQPRCMTLGELAHADGTPIDQALIAWFPGPHSYTGNDLVEFHCHGAPAVVQAAVEALVTAGARMARPGEFTERAFLNGRMDLAQAEAVADLVAARTEAASRAALSQLQGSLSHEVTTVREAVLEVAAELEAGLDFPEEETGAGERERLAALFADALQRMHRLAETYRRGRLLREGARVVLAGRPNAGKSSVFNNLVGMERAIVTPHPGTTRDSIEATLDLNGVAVTLVDTAGIHQAGEENVVERLGIERSRLEVEKADLVIFLLEGGAVPCAEDAEIYELAKMRPHITVVNKADLAETRDGSVWDAYGATLWISAQTGEGMRELETRMASALGMEEGVQAREAAQITNLRHAELLNGAFEALKRAQAAFESGLFGELTMVDVSETLENLGGILGLAVDDAVLDRIFARFCIGK